MTCYPFKYFHSCAFDNMFAFANLWGFFPFLSFFLLPDVSERGENSTTEISTGPLGGVLGTSFASP